MSASNSLDQMTKWRDVQMRGVATMAAVQHAFDACRQPGVDKILAGRTDHPMVALRGIILDLFDGCWDSGFASGQDTKAPE